MKYFVQFSYFASEINPIVNYATIKPLRKNADLVRINSNTFAFSAIDEAHDLEGIPADEAKAEALRLGYIETETDFSVMENRFDLEKIKACNPPAEWLKAFELKLAFEG